MLYTHSCSGHAFFHHLFCLFLLVAYPSEQFPSSHPLTLAPDLRIIFLTVNRHNPTTSSALVEENPARSLGSLSSARTLAYGFLLFSNRSVCADFLFLPNNAAVEMFSRPLTFLLYAINIKSSHSPRPDALGFVCHERRLVRKEKRTKNGMNVAIWFLSVTYIYSHMTICSSPVPGLDTCFPTRHTRREEE